MNKIQTLPTEFQLKQIDNKLKPSSRINCDKRLRERHKEGALGASAHETAP